MHQKYTKWEKSQQLIPFYLCLQKYYCGDLNHLNREEGQALAQALSQEPVIADNPKLAQCVHRLEKAFVEAKEPLAYSFNRLFVGPDKLLAPPYESYYRNEFRTLMQGETLKVRWAYEQAGLQLVEKNKMPDDFIGLELEFIIALLESSQWQEASDHYTFFLENHLFTWYAPHCQLILENSDHPVCQAMAQMLVSILDSEKDNVKFKEGINDGI